MRKSLSIVPGDSRKYFNQIRPLDPLSHQNAPYKKNIRNLIYSSDSCVCQFFTFNVSTILLLFRNNQQSKPQKRNK